MNESNSLKAFLHSRKATQVVGPLIALAAVIFLFGIPDLFGEGQASFLTPVNFKYILVQSVIVSIAALGMTMVIVSGGIDLSVGSVIAFSSVLGAVLIQKELATVVVVGGTLCGGMFFGLLNGVIIAKFRMNPFIVTLGMMGVARGAAKWLANNQTVYYEDSSVNYLMNNPSYVPDWVPFSHTIAELQLLGRPIPPALEEGQALLELWVPPVGVLVAILMAAGMAILMSRTVFGRHIFAVGSNEATARLCGIHVPRTKLALYIIAGLVYGLAGLMQLSRLQQGSPTVAIGLELDVIAAVVIGGASLSGGIGSVFGAVIGALIMAVLRNGSQQMGWETYVQEIMIGAVIILAVGLDRLRQKTQ